MKFLLLIFRNMRRNLLRSALTALGTIGLVVVVTLIWSVLTFLDQATVAKSTNLKAIITEKWQNPSQMPWAYAATLSEGAAQGPGDIRPMDSMTWQFYVGTTDPANKSWTNTMFAFVLEPKKLLTMMDELDALPPDEMAEWSKTVEKLEANRQGMIMGKDRLKQFNKVVGQKIILHGINYKDIDLEFEIVGVFPEGRYDLSAAMNTKYLNDSIEAYKGTHNNTPHPLADKSLALVWLKVPDMPSFNKVAEQIVTSPYYGTPAVKCETASSAIATFLEAYRDLIWGARWLLSPAIIITLALVIANAISISVRERRTELAVLKVLGFRPAHLLVLVLGEALLLGVAAGLAGALSTYVIINDVMGGFKVPIGFFGTFYIPASAFWWGAILGGGAALAGSIVPALGARSVKVSEVFAKVG